MLIFKFVVLAAALSILSQACIVFRLGYQLVLERRSTGEHDPRTLKRKRWAVGILIGMFTALVVYMRVAVMNDPVKQSINPIFLWSHIASITLFTATLFSMVVLNGKRFPLWHKRVRYPSVALFFIAAATGGYMLYLLPN